MKFVSKISNVGRLGVLTNYSSHDAIDDIPTPNYFRYACAGNIPHLTRDMQLNCMTTVEGNVLLQPLSTIEEFQDSVKEMGKGLASFAGLPQDQPYHISVQDPTCCTPSGYNTKKGVSVWTHSGNKIITPEKFVSMQRSFCPSSYQALCDSDTPLGCSKKRLEKAVRNSLSFLDKCLEEHNKYEELKHTAVFGTIQGGYDAALRRECTMEVVKRPVQGFVIDGFHLNGPSIAKLEFEKVKPILEDVLNLLPKDKLTVMNGPFDLLQILEAVKCGVDLFDSSYPSIMSEKGQALDLLSGPAIPNCLETPIKKLKRSFELDMNDSSFSDLHRPMVTGCECYTCKRFTCAYIHHLLITSELLSKVLLTVHNLFQFEVFFSFLRDSVKSQDFSKLEQLLGV